MPGAIIGNRANLDKGCESLLELFEFRVSGGGVDDIFDFRCELEEIVTLCL